MRCLLRLPARRAKVSRANPGHAAPRAALLLPALALTVACGDARGRAGGAPPPAESAAEIDGEAAASPVHLPGPAREQVAARGREISRPATWPVEDEQAAPLQAYAFRFNSRVFDLTPTRTRTVGIFRRGTWLAATRSVVGPGCTNGRWYALASRGYVCDSDGVDVSGAIPEAAPTSRRPDLTGALPYSYAVVRADKPPRLTRPPQRWEHERIENARATNDPWPEVVARWMVGDYFVALDERTETAEGAFWRTVRGHYVYEKDIEPLPLPPMMGNELEGADDLPLAFVVEDEAPVFRIRQEGLEPAGRADRHARLKVREVIEEDGEEFVSTGELVLRRSAVRLAEEIPRPDQVPEGEKWIHVDLAEQTLVAYDPDGPVYATLVSSGRQGYETPRGTFRVRKKYLTHSMSGKDPVYDVEEVPWAMYYFKSYAIHGTYWHNRFGEPRSRGCTNIAPVDAKWLFYWSSPELPSKWHGVMLAEGTHVHLTR